MVHMCCLKRTCVVIVVVWRMEKEAEDSVS